MTQGQRRWMHVQRDLPTSLAPCQLHPASADTKQPREHICSPASCILGTKDLFRASAKVGPSTSRSSRICTGVGTRCVNALTASRDRPTSHSSLWISIAWPHALVDAMMGCQTHRDHFLESTVHDGRAEVLIALKEATTSTNSQLLGALVSLNKQCHRVHLCTGTVQHKAALRSRHRLSPVNCKSDVLISDCQSAPTQSAAVVCVQPVTKQALTCTDTKTIFLFLVVAPKQRIVSPALWPQVHALLTLATKPACCTSTSVLLGRAAELAKIAEPAATLLRSRHPSQWMPPPARS